MTRAATSAAWSLPERRRGDHLREYWLAARGSPDADLAKVVKGLKSGWLLLLPSVAVAAVVAVIVHLVVALPLGTSSLFLQTVGTATMLVLAAAIVVPLMWAYRRTRRDPTEAAPYTVALLSSAVAIVVSGQAFAALSVYLAQRGLVEGQPSLLSAESSYAWHFLGAVPFVDVTGTLHWNEPGVLQDNLSGALILAFKIAIIGPVIRLGFSAYHLLEKLRSDGAEAKPRAAIGRDYVTAGTATLAFAVGLPIVVALYVAVSLFFDSGSRPNRWLSGLVPDHLETPAVQLSTSWARDLSDRLPDQVDWPSVAVPLSWLEVTPQWGLAVAFVWAAMGVFALAFLVDVKARGPRWRLIGPLGAYLCLLLIVAELWSAVSLALLHSDFLSTNESLPAGEELRTTMTYYAWHAADSIPALDVPQTLNWSLRHEYVGHAGDGLLLAFKLVFLTVLAFPLMRVVRSAARAAPAAAGQRPAGLVAAKRYTAVLGEVEAALDTAEELVSRRRPTRLPQQSASAAREEAGSQIRELRSALIQVERAFGASEVALTADATVRAAEQRLDLLGAPPKQRTKKALHARRELLSKAGNAYRSAALEAVRREKAGPSPP